MVMVLPAPLGPNDAEYLAPLHLEADAMQDFAADKGLPEALHFDDMVHDSAS